MIESNVCAAWKIADLDSLIASSLSSWFLRPFSAPALIFAEDKKGEEEEGFRWCKGSLPGIFLLLSFSLDTITWP